MKQQITLKQLNELSNEQFEIIKTWFAKHCNDPFYSMSEAELPLLSIGQMIEYIDEYLSKNQDEFNIRIHSAGSAWKYPGQRLTDIDPPIEFEIEDEVELCDALWQMVKQILGKDKDEERNS